MEWIITVGVLLLAGVFYAMTEDRSTLQDKIDEYKGIKDDQETDDFLPW
jgi:hypothetical protein